MTLGYLHVGSPEHGVTRYGRMLAEGARAHLDDRVVEASVELAGPPVQHRGAIVEAATVLSPADVVHVQYNARIWGEPERALANVRTFVESCPAPIVVTLHDVRTGYGFGSILRRLWAQRSGRRGAGGEGGRSGGASEAEWPGASLVRSGTKAVRFIRHERANARATRYLARHAARVLVCTTEEAHRARDLPSVEPVVLPHFVEDRPHDANRDVAKESTDLAGHRVVSVLGYIHRRKGHDLVVEALPDLPDDVVAVFVGRPGRDSPGFARALRQRARALDVADRVRVTGYVDEDVLNTYLAATDVAVCPFRSASASGSLSTWIAAERPIVASDLPLIDDYEALVSGAIARFAPFSPSALAATLRDALDRPDDAVRPALRELRTALAVPTVLRQHRDVYVQVATHRDATHADD